jgi:hypothetical protein
MNSSTGAMGRREGGRGGGGEQINITFYDGIKFAPSLETPRIYLFSLKEPANTARAGQG